MLREKILMRERTKECISKTRVDWTRKKKMGGEGDNGVFAGKERSLDQSLLCELDTFRYFFRQLLFILFQFWKPK